MLRKTDSSSCGVNPLTKRCRKPPIGQNAPSDRCKLNEETNYCILIKSKKNHENKKIYNKSSSNKLCDFNSITNRCAKSSTGKDAPHPKCELNKTTNRCNLVKSTKNTTLSKQETFVKLDDLKIEPLPSAIIPKPKKTRPKEVELKKSTRTKKPTKRLITEI